MEKSSQIAWKIVPLRHFFPLKVVPLIEVLLYVQTPARYMVCCIAIIYIKKLKNKEMGNGMSAACTPGCTTARSARIAARPGPKTSG
jgi:hypothetical protein